MKKHVITWIYYLLTAFFISTFVHAAPNPTLGPFTITISAGPNGTLSPNGILTVNNGDSRIFIASPATGFKVSAWLVDGVVAQTSGTHFLLANITSNHNVQVNFSNNLTLLYAGGANGNVYYSAMED